MTTNFPQQSVQKKGFSFRDLTPYLYIIPSLVLFITFVFYPFVKTIYLSLHTTDPTGAAHWICRFRELRDGADGQQYVVCYRRNV